MEKRKTIGVLGTLFFVLSVVFVLFYRVTFLEKTGFMGRFGFWPGVVVGCAFVIAIFLRVVLFKD